MNQERLFKVLLGPHITEKSASASGSATQVAFKVATDASKLEVKKAVEKLFEVKVDGVRVVNVKAKHAVQKLAWASVAIGRRLMFVLLKVKILTSR